MDPVCTLIGQNPEFYQSIKTRKNYVLLFFPILPVYHKANKAAKAV